MTNDIEALAKRVEEVLCEVCEQPMTDGGVDYYCETFGCENEHTLINVVLAAMRAEAALRARAAEGEG